MSVLSLSVRFPCATFACDRRGLGSHDSKRSCGDGGDLLVGSKTHRSHCLICDSFIGTIFVNRQTHARQSRKDTKSVQQKDPKHVNMLRPRRLQAQHGFITPQHCGDGLPALPAICKASTADGMWHIFARLA